MNNFDKLVNVNGTVTYKRITVTNRQKICKNCLSGDGSRLNGGEDCRGVERSAYVPNK